MNPYDDDNMFLRHIRQQIQDAQKGNLLNERLMESMNRPSNIQSPFYTKLTQGDPGKFASPQPLQFPGSTIPKTTMPPPVPPTLSQPQNKQQWPMMGPNPFMPKVDPNYKLPDNPNSIQNILRSLMGR